MSSGSYGESGLAKLPQSLELDEPTLSVEYFQQMGDVLFAYLIVNLIFEGFILLLGGGEEQADEVSVCSADEAEGLVEGRREGWHSSHSEFFFLFSFSSHLLF